MANRNHYARQMRRRMGIASQPMPVKRRTSPPKPKVMMAAAPTPTKRPLANLGKRIVNFFRRPTVTVS